MSRTETADLLNLVARSRINAGAAAWHAHGKSHPSDPEGDQFEIPEPAKAARQRSLPTAMQPPTTGTALDMLGDDLVQDYTKYHNSTDPTKQPFTYGYRKPDAQTEAGRNKALAKVTKVSSAADRTAFAKDIAHTRYSIGKAAYPTAGPMWCDCECGHKGYSRDGTVRCAPCRLAVAHVGHDTQLTTLAEHTCLHCQVCGCEGSQYAVAGLTWACHTCASHVAGVMQPTPKLFYRLPRQCTSCQKTLVERWGLDGRPLCLKCQDYTAPLYRLARAGMIVQDYLAVCIGQPRVIMTNQHTKTVLHNLALLLPDYTMQGGHFTPTPWEDIADNVHAAAAVVLMQPTLPKQPHACTTAHTRHVDPTKYEHITTRVYGTEANYTLLDTRSEPPTTYDFAHEHEGGEEAEHGPLLPPTWTRPTRNTGQRRPRGTTHSPEDTSQHGPPQQRRREQDVNQPTTPPPPPTGAAHTTGPAAGSSTSGGGHRADADAPEGGEQRAG